MNIPNMPEQALEQCIALRIEGKRYQAYQAACMGLIMLQGQSDPIGAKLASHAIQFGAYSACYDPKNHTSILRDWLRHDPSNPEPLLRLSLLEARIARMAGKEPTKQTLSNLFMCQSVFGDIPRAKACLAWAQSTSTDSVQVPYDGGHLTCYGDPSNLTAFVLLEQGDWFEDELKYFRSQCVSGAHILDLGANVGCYGYSAAKRVGKTGKVFSVEPILDTYFMMHETRKRENLQEQWHPCAYAMGRTTGMCYMGESKHHELHKVCTTGRETVMACVDDLLNDREDKWKRLDLIKLDVEGQEIATLQGAQRTLERFNPQIIYEVKDQVIDYHTINAIEALGYKNYVYNSYTNSLSPFDRGNVDEFLLNLVAIRS